MLAQSPINRVIESTPEVELFLQDLENPRTGDFSKADATDLWNAFAGDFEEDFDPLVGIGRLADALVMEAAEESARVGAPTSSMRILKNLASLAPHVERCCEAVDHGMEVALAEFRNSTGRQAREVGAHAAGIVAEVRARMLITAQKLGDSLGEA